MFLWLVFVMLSRLFIAALWSPAGKGLTSWPLLVISLFYEKKSEKRKKMIYPPDNPNFSHKTIFTFQLLQLTDTMRPEDDLCMDKVKEMYARSIFFSL